MCHPTCLATKNIKEADSKLIECYDPDSGAGFYVRSGNKAAIYCKTGQPALKWNAHSDKVKNYHGRSCRTIYHLCITWGSNYSCIKLYLNGEEVGCMGYISNSGAIPIQNHNIWRNGRRPVFVCKFAYKAVIMNGRKLLETICASWLILQQWYWSMKRRMCLIHRIVRQ